MACQMTRCIIQFHNFREHPLIRFSHNNHATDTVYLVANTDSLRSVIGGSLVLGL